MLVGQITDYVSLANFTLRGTIVDGSQAKFTKGSAADLATGAWVQVTGQLTPTGVRAAEIAVQPPPADKPQRLAGEISAVDAAAKTFTLLGTKVQWSATTKVSPDGKSLASLTAGTAVSVEGSFSTATGVFTATKVMLNSTTPGATKVIGFSGIVHDVTTQSLKIGSYVVQIGPNTQLLPAGTKLTDVTNGSRVSIKAYVMTNSGSTTLTAVAIELQRPEKDPSGANYVYLSGLIGDFVSSADFKVGSQKIDASGTDVKFIDGDASKLASGAKVEIKGIVKDGVLIAKVIHFMPG